MRYLKPHGALYHRVTDDPEQAEAVLAGSGELPVLGFPGSRLLALAAAAGRAAYDEGFPDRGYRDGRLIDRGEPGALLEDDEAIAAQAVDLAPDVASLCVHGDSPGAVAHAHAVRRALEAARIPARGRSCRVTADFSTAAGSFLWRIGRVPVDDEARSVEDTPRRAKCRRNRRPEPLARAARAGHRTLLPTRRLRRGGAEKQEDPDRELARGAGRWRQAGSEGLSGDRVPPHDHPRGSWCSYHREPLTYFTRRRRSAPIA